LPNLFFLFPERKLSDDSNVKVVVAGCSSFGDGGGGVLDGGDAAIVLLAATAAAFYRTHDGRSNVVELKVRRALVALVALGVDYTCVLDVQF
jgi:hypothetical protein